MMWVVHLTALSLGARVICYDGSPLHPTPEAFVKLSSDQDVTLLGTSPRWLSELHGRGIDPRTISFLFCAFQLLILVR